MSRLFEPLKVGDITLGHRIVMAPLTRYRADDQHVHGDLAVEYYSQRASFPGTLLITEATFIAPEAGGYPNVPGLWNDAQVTAWRRVTDAVHKRGSFIFAQLWALGRAASPKVLQREGPFDLVSSGDIPLEGSKVKPRPLTKEEIKNYARLYATAAENAIKAGFDGVEIHGANGYLIDQFTQSTANNRTDEYGGSIENRCRFALEVVKAVTDAIGPKKTGIRFGPWTRFQGMRMPDPIPTFTYLVEQLRDHYSDLAYIHCIEPTILGDKDQNAVKNDESNEFARAIWQPRPFFAAGGFNAKSGPKLVQERGGAVVYGRYFISNPDLPARLKNGIPLSRWNRDSFYLRKDPKGYIDYPFAKELEGISSKL